MRQRRLLSYEYITPNFFLQGYTECQEFDFLEAIVLYLHQKIFLTIVTRSDCNIIDRLHFKLKEFFSKCARYLGNDQNLVPEHEHHGSRCTLQFSEKHKKIWHHGPWLRFM